MQAHFYRHFVEAWAAGAVNPVADPLHVRLLGSLYLFDPGHSLADVLECAAETPAMPLAVSVNGASIATEPVTWPEAAPARGCVVYRLGLPVAHYDFGRLVQPDGELRIEWDENVLFDVRATDS